MYSFIKILDWSVPSKYFPKDIKVFMGYPLSALRTIWKVGCWEGQMVSSHNPMKKIAIMFRNKKKIKFLYQKIIMAYMEKRN